MRERDKMQEHDNANGLTILYDKLRFRLRDGRAVGDVAVWELEGLLEQAEMEAAILRGALIVCRASLALSNNDAARQ